MAACVPRLRKTRSPSRRRIPPWAIRTSIVLGATKRPSPRMKSRPSTANRALWIAIRPSTMSRLRCRTPAMSRVQGPRRTPKVAAWRTRSTTFALWIMFLLGRQAMLGHEPPINPRSTTATRCPDRASSQAIYLPASPPPKTTFGKRSLLLIRLSPQSLFVVALSEQQGYLGGCLYGFGQMIPKSRARGRTDVAQTTRRTNGGGVGHRLPDLVAAASGLLHSGMRRAARDGYAGKPVIPRLGTS